MSNPYTPFILVIKDIENNKLSSYNGRKEKNKIKEKINEVEGINDKKENKNLKKNFSFDDFFKIHLF